MGDVSIDVLHVSLLRHLTLHLGLLAGGLGWSGGQRAAHTRVSSYLVSLGGLLTV